MSGKKVNLKKYAGVLSQRRSEELKKYIKRTRIRISKDFEKRLKTVNKHARN